jgi:hypothetical protein
MISMNTKTLKQKGISEKENLICDLLNKRSSLEAQKNLEISKLTNEIDFEIAILNRIKERTS